MTPVTSNLTPERLRYLLSYNPETGVLIWIGGKRKKRIGTTAGGPGQGGYLRLMVDGQRYMLHRLAWLHVTGKWPVNEIDHISGDKKDNRFKNLREATREINTQNMRTPRKDNKCGFLGVSFNRDRFLASIEYNKQRVYLGSYKKPELAHAAYLTAKRELHAGCTI